MGVERQQNGMGFVAHYILFSERDGQPATNIIVVICMAEDAVDV